ncbi:hypothetical protein ACSN7J_003945 [Enterobacter hormaechei]
MLDKQLDIFYKKISFIKLYAATVKNNTNKILDDLFDKKEQIDKFLADPNISPEVKDFNGIEFRNFVFHSPYTGTLESIDHKTLKIEERIEIVELHKNKQYQWLLSEAYEVYEDYLEDLYACIGFIDHSFWPARDFGDISLTEIPQQDIAWFRTQVKQKKDKPKSILYSLRKKIPSISQIELSNENNVHYQFATLMIENFRHIIVHNNGNFNNKAEFTKNLLHKSGIKNNFKPNLETYINKYTGNKDGIDFILLLEQHIAGKFMFLDKLDGLINVLLSHALIINTETIKYINNKK